MSKTPEPVTGTIDRFGTMLITVGHSPVKLVRVSDAEVRSLDRMTCDEQERTMRRWYERRADIDSGAMVR